MKKIVQLLIGSVVFGQVAFAALENGSPLLSYVNPGGAGQGETVDVQFYGSNFYDPLDVLFYDPAIKFVEFVEIPEVKTPMYTRYDGRASRWLADRLLIARIKVDKNCRPGRHHLRLLTEGGLSVQRSFFIGRFPSIPEVENYKEPNHEAEFAQAIPLNHTVNGALHRFDVDAFKVALKKGQRFTAEVESFRLASHQSGESDLKLTLKTVGGKEIAECGDSALFLADPFLSVKVPESGEYLVEVRDEIIERNSNPKMYRLHLGDYVRPSALFPPGGKAGAQTAFKVLGDPLGEWTYKSTLAQSEDGFADLLVQKDGKSLPVGHTVRVSAADNSIESEPNDKPEQASKAHHGFPIALNGVVNKPGDVDYYTFEVPANLAQQVKVRVFAQGIGSPLDPKMSFYEKRSDGKKGQNKNSDDIQGNRLNRMWLNNHTRELLDPIELLSSTGKDNKTFVLQITDTHGRGGDGFVYRVEIDEVKPHVYAHMPSFENQGYYQARNRIKVAKKNQYVAWMSVAAAYGFKLDSDVELIARDLPAGVKMIAPVLKKGADRVPVVFEADGSAKPGAYLFDVIAKSKGESFSSSFQQPNAFSTRGGGVSQLHTFVDQLALYVTEEAPFSITVVKPETPLVPNGELSFNVKVKRKAGFEEPIELRMDWVPREVNRAVGVQIDADETEKQFTLVAGSRAEPGEYQVAVLAKSKGGNPRDGRDIIWAGSKFVPLTISESKVKVRLARSSVERGKSAEVKCTVEFLQPFEGKAKVRLIRLPRGVEMVDEYVEVSAKDTEFSIKIRATEAALFGMNKGVMTEFEFKQGKGSFKEKSGYGYLRIDPERGKKVVRVSP